MRRLLNFIQEPVLLLSRTGEVQLANGAARTLLGADPTGASLFDFVEGEQAALKRHLARASGSTQPVPGAVVLRTADGSAKRLQTQAALLQPAGPHGDASLVLRCRPFGVEEFSILGQKIRELNQEIRHRRRLQATLEEALAHKETLLRELHHRVKNQTQMLLGMFAAAAREARSDELKAFLEIISSRLMAIGAAQQLMYSGNRVETISGREFIETLCRAISDSWPAHVRVDTSCDEVELSNELAFPLALIINELAANALKHGLKFGPGQVAVSLHRCDGELVLAVWDSGRGWAGNGGLRRSSGLSLVKGLCRQIGGKFMVSCEEGTCCLVRFPLEEGEKVDA